MNKPQLLIAGEWVTTGRAQPVVNPYDEGVIGEVPVASEADVDKAIAGAESGFKEMRALPAHARAAILYRCADLLTEQADEFVQTIAQEAGKPVKFAQIEVARGIETLRYTAEEAKRIHGETVPMDALKGSEKRRGFFLRVPIGVIAAITPFNFPLNLVIHKLAPAFASGNAVVLKPASATPLTALKLSELLLRAGLPPKALNVVVGPGASIGSALIQDARVRMITFTGSPRVGEQIKTQSGLKRVTLELGSNSGVIVDETADLGKALVRCLYGGFAYSGQVCNHTQRLYLHRSIAPDFLAKFISETQKLICGNPIDPNTDIGPLINRSALLEALAMIEEARAGGAVIACGGRAEGTILLPTVLTEVHPEMRVVSEETFAPIVTVETFADFEEAIARFNEGSRLGTFEYGISAGVFTRDLNRAWRAIEELDVANVYINDSATFRADLQPYGGIKDSGIGREGPRFAIEEMTEIKMVSFNLES